MAFVKLDTGMLDSTLWIDREAREVFITALLMAEPRELKEPVWALKPDSLESNGFEIPAGWYGFVRAAGPGIVRRAMVDPAVGMIALQRLSDPDLGSRSADFEGRRLMRVDGGYVVLNYMKYRERDYTAGERMKRYRERQKDKKLRRNGVDVRRNVTQAEAEVEIARPRAKRAQARTRLADLEKFTVTEGMQLWAHGIGIPHQRISPETEKFMDHHRAKGSLMADWEAAWQTWMRRVIEYQPLR